MKQPKRKTKFSIVDARKFLLLVGFIGAIIFVGIFSYGLLRGTNERKIKQQKDTKKVQHTNRPHTKDDSARMMPEQEFDEHVKPGLIDQCMKAAWVTVAASSEPAKIFRGRLKIQEKQTTPEGMGGYYLQDGIEVFEKRTAIVDYFLGKEVELEIIGGDQTQKLSKIRCVGSLADSTQQRYRRTMMEFIAEKIGEIYPEAAGASVYAYEWLDTSLVYVNLAKKTEPLCNSDENDCEEVMRLLLETSMINKEPFVLVQASYKSGESDWELVSGSDPNLRYPFFDVYEYQESTHRWALQN